MHRPFTRVTRVGPVNVGTRPDQRGKPRHTAACTAPNCGWSASYSNRDAADLAARTHRCPAH
ncbi:mobile element transfer protein [Yinghuangia sp. YIM S09857]|uniref:mobile element transfer protein n=1 Tax=Yinghuangia sp. YIM S09857 TaxID=3436929 RepID=UPI003F52F4B9